MNYDDIIFVEIRANQLFLEICYAQMIRSKLVTTKNLTPGKKILFGTRHYFCIICLLSGQGINRIPSKLQNVSKESSPSFRAFVLEKSLHYLRARGQRSDRRRPSSVGCTGRCGWRWTCRLRPDGVGQAGSRPWHSGSRLNFAGFFLL